MDSLVDRCLRSGQPCEQTFSSAVDISPTDLLAIDSPLAHPEQGQLHLLCTPLFGSTGSSGGSSEVVGVLRLLTRKRRLLAESGQGQREEEEAQEEDGEEEEQHLSAARRLVWEEGSYVMQAVVSATRLLPSPPAATATASATSASASAGAVTSKEKEERLRKVHKVVLRECCLLLDPPSTSSSTATSSVLQEEEGLHHVRHLATLPPLQAVSEVSIKALQVVRHLLRSDGQAIVLRDSPWALPPAASSSPSALHVLYTGDAILHAGIPPATFGALPQLRGGAGGRRRSLVEEVLQSRRALLLDDLYTATEAEGSHAVHPQIDGLSPSASSPCAYLAVPLRGSSGTIIGLLYAVRPRPFGREEQMALETVAFCAALSIYWVEGLACRHQQLQQAWQRVSRLEEAVLRLDPARP